MSNDSYILKIDDLNYERAYNHALYYNIYLDGELVMEEVTEMTFLLEDLTAGSHIAEVEAIYETGASEKTEVIISMLGTAAPEMKDFVVYPNPTSGRFSLELDSQATVTIYDLNGRILYTGVKEAGTSIMEHHLSAGTYIIQVQTENGTASKKLIFY